MRSDSPEEGEAVLDEPDELDEDEEPEDEYHPSHDMTTFKHTLLTVAIVASGFTIAYFVDDLKMGMWSDLWSIDARF